MAVYISLFSNFIPSMSQRDMVADPLLTLKLFARCFLILAIALGTLALTQPERPYRLKESIIAPRGWEKVASAPADHTIHLRIGLPQANFAELERHLHEISDPSHSRYGQHLSKAEVEAFVAPKQESIKLVDDWLTSFGLGLNDVSRSSARDWIIVRVPVRIAEKMLNTVTSLAILVLPCLNLAISELSCLEIQGHR